MGWFELGPLCGDDGMNSRDEIFDIIGVQYDENYDILSSCEEITQMLDENQDKLYDWIQDYDWSKRCSPSFIQEVYVQALMQVLIDYNVKISERGKKDAIPFIENDSWAKESIERANAMNLLLRHVRES